MDRILQGGHTHEIISYLWVRFHCQNFACQNCACAGTFKQDRLFLFLHYSLLSNQTNDHNLFSLVDNENERKTVAL